MEQNHLFQLANCVLSLVGDSRFVGRANLSLIPADAAGNTSQAPRLSSHLQCQDSKHQTAMKDTR